MSAASKMLLQEPNLSDFYNRKRTNVFLAKNLGSKKVGIIETLKLNITSWKRRENKIKIRMTPPGLTP